MTPRGERARPMSPDERRDAIVAATVPLLARQGGTVTTKEIAEAAGIAEGTIFRVFKDKRELFMTVAERVMNPPGGREEMAAYLAGVEGLRAQMVLVVERLVARMEQGMLVMMALRSVFMAEAADKQATPAKHDKPDKHEKPGPPAFVLESNRQLMRNLTEVLFEPHAAELRVEPAKAALVLRGLVFGAWHPGMPSPEHPLTPDEVADVVLGGIAVPSKAGNLRC